MAAGRAEYPITYSRRAALARSDVLVGVALVIVMLLGGYFRFVGQNWDDFTHLHPDERFLTDVASSLGGSIRSTAPGEAIEKQAQVDRCLARYPATGGVGSYFDAECSTLNPHNAGKGLYVYGTLPLFLARGAGDLLVQLTGDTTLNTYSGVHLVWRTISALAEMSAILIVFLIGVQLHDRWVGLLAAGLYTGAVFSIQVAHFGTADATTNFFAVLGILFAVRAQMQGKLLDYALFGVAFGGALASRVNIAPLAGLIVLAAMLRVLPALDYRMMASERWRLIWRNGASLALAGVLSVLIFRIFNPYAFMGPGFFGLTPQSTLAGRYCPGALSGQRSSRDAPELAMDGAHPLAVRVEQYGSLGDGAGAGSDRVGRVGLVRLPAAARATGRAAQSAAVYVVSGLFWLAGRELGGDDALLFAGVPGVRVAGGLAAGGTGAPGG